MSPPPHVHGDMHQFRVLPEPLLIRFCRLRIVRHNAHDGGELTRHYLPHMQIADKCVLVAFHGSAYLVRQVR